VSSVISYLRADEPTSRETRIFTCGIILIAIGGAFAFLTLAIAYGLAVGAVFGSRLGIVPPGRGPGSTLALLTPILLFSVSAVVFIWTGIGSVQMRRWCRPIVMSLSALAVAGGLLFLLNLALQSWFVPDLSTPVVRRRAATASGAMDGEMILFLATYVVLGIIVPLVFFAAYRDRHVERTLDEADPRLYWTDRCPAPVLAFALCMLQIAYALILLLPMVMIAPATPVFGFPLDPAPACGVFLLTAALCVVAAHLTHKQSPVGPWLGMAITVAIGASILASTVIEPPPPPRSPYQRFAPQQPAPDNVAPSVILTVAVYTIPVVLFALWVLRLLNANPSTQAQSAEPPAPPQLSDLPVPPVRAERPPLLDRLRARNSID
jgi:hypothetical protein